jgi:hypothetical protein
MADSFPTTENRVFHRLTVETHFNMITDKRVLVEWALEKDFIAAAPGPYKFTLYRGYAANDDNFEAIAYTFDQPWLYDNNPQLPLKGMDVFYKVLLEDSAGNQYWSQAAHGTTYWERYDWTIAREIIRKEHLLQRKRAGTKGWLLKRRLWGEKCPADCVDPITDQVNYAHCDECYGTGILGGYYDPIEYWIIMNPSQRIKKLDPNQGLTTTIIETVRALAYPAPATNDIWVHAHTDQRYNVMEDISAIARHRGINLVLNLRLKERSRSESIYKVPTPCE